MGTCLLLHADHTKSQRILNIAEHMQFLKIGTVREIEVFEKAGALVVELQVPSRQPGNAKSLVRNSRGIEQLARQFVPFGAVLSPQSSSCGRPRAQTQT